MDFDSFKNTVNRIRVFKGKLLRFFKRVCLDHDEAAGFIGQRSSKNDSAGLVKRFYVCQMGGAVYFSFGFAVGTVETDNDEFHHCRAPKRLD